MQQSSGEVRPLLLLAAAALLRLLPPPVGVEDLARRSSRSESSWGAEPAPLDAMVDAIVGRVRSLCY